MTTPSLTLLGRRRVQHAEPFVPRLAFPVLSLGLTLALIGYAALAVALLRLLF